MNELEVKDKIEEALEKLKDKDFVLLKNDLNERTISHRLAIYIEDIFTEYDVDCEYNKIPEGSKILDIISRKGTLEDDTKAVIVYPDIIVHKRDTDNNFMVIEIKKSTNNSNKEIDYDKRKLKAYKSQLGYKFGIFINIPTGENYSTKDNEIEFI